MAQQFQDQATPDMPDAKRRGRPPTGHALSPAQRKHQQRRRDTRLIWTAGDIAAASVEGLITAIRHCITEGHVTRQKDLLREAMRRTVLNRHSHKNTGTGQPDNRKP